LKALGIGEGKPWPSGVSTTLTGLPSAKNEYCPPGTDAIPQSLQFSR
jgi:hypothetical protein